MRINVRDHVIRPRQGSAATIAAASATCIGVKPRATAVSAAAWAARAASGGENGELYTYVNDCKCIVVYLSIYLSIYLSVYLAIYLSIYLSIYLIYLT